MRIHSPDDTIKNLTAASKFICDAYGTLVYKGDKVVYNSANQLKIGLVTDINITKAFYVPDQDYLDLTCYIKVEEIYTRQPTTLRKTTTLIKK